MSSITIRIFDTRENRLLETFEWPQVPPIGVTVRLPGGNYKVEDALWNEEEEVQIETGREDRVGRLCVVLKVVRLGGE